MFETDGCVQNFKYEKEKLAIFDVLNMFVISSIFSNIKNHLVIFKLVLLVVNDIKIAFYYLNYY